MFISVLYHLVLSTVCRQNDSAYDQVSKFVHGTKLVNSSNSARWERCT